MRTIGVIICLALATFLSHGQDQVNLNKPVPPEESLKAFRKKPSPENALQVGLSYYTVQEYSNAIVYLSKATLKNVDSKIASNAYLYRGMARIARKEFPDAYADLRKSLALNPKNSDVYRIRGFAQISSGAPIKAIQDFSTYVMYMEKSWESYNQLANDILKTGTTNKELLEKADDLAKMSAEKNSNAQNKQTLDQVAVSIKKIKTNETPQKSLETTPAPIIVKKEIPQIPVETAKVDPNKEVKQVSKGETTGQKKPTLNEVAVSTKNEKATEVPPKPLETAKVDGNKEVRQVSKDETTGQKKPTLNEVAVSTKNEKANETAKPLEATKLDAVTTSKQVSTNEVLQNQTREIAVSTPESKTVSPSKNKPSDGKAVEVLDIGKMRKAKVWAVIVGVSVYKTTQSLNLQYANSDAELFYNFLRSPAGGNIPADQIALITNEKATRMEILKAMKTTFGRAYNTDVIILYIASHGQTENGEFYFLTTEADPGFLEATALSRTSVAEAFNGKNVRAKKKIIFADACHSGELMKVDLGTARGGGESDELEKSNRLLVEMAQTNEGCAIMTASTGGQKSYEDVRWGGGHGVFTFSLIEGLKGQADYDDDKIVTLNELNEYVFRSVTDATQRKQQPSFQGSFDEHFPMSIVIK